MEWPIPVQVDSLTAGPVVVGSVLPPQAILQSRSDPSTFRRGHALQLMEFYPSSFNLESNLVLSLTGPLEYS